MAATSQNRGDLLANALSLPVSDRAKLAQELVDSLPEDYGWTDHMKSDVRDAWIGEARRRVTEIDDGRTTLLDGDEVMQRMRERFGS